MFPQHVLSHQIPSCFYRESNSRSRFNIVYFSTYMLCLSCVESAIPKSVTVSMVARLLFLPVDPKLGLKMLGGPLIAHILHHIIKIKITIFNLKLLNLFNLSNDQYLPNHCYWLSCSSRLCGFSLSFCCLAVQIVFES